MTFVGIYPLKGTAEPASETTEAEDWLSNAHHYDNPVAIIDHFERFAEEAAEELQELLTSNAESRMT